jgi:hypothetical protein
MLLTENITLRVREWLDRKTDEPDLVRRLRRVWAQPRVPPGRENAGRRRSAALMRRPALLPRPGV